MNFSHQTRLARLHPHYSIQAHRINERITACLCWGILSARKPVQLKSRYRGQTPRGETTGVPFEFTALLSSCCQQPTRQLKLVSADKTSHISHVVVTPPPETTRAPHRTEPARGGFRAPVRHEMSRGSPLIILSKARLHFSAEAVGSKARQGALSTLPLNSDGSDTTSSGKNTQA